MILEELPIAATFLTPKKQKLLRAIKKQCWVGNQDTLTQLWLSFLKIILLFSICVHAHVYIFGCLQKLEASGPLEPKLQKVVIHLTQVRRTKLGFSARAANVLTTVPSLQLPISLSYVWYLWGLSRNSYFHPRDVPRIKQSKNIAWRCWENWRWVRPGAQAYKSSYWTSNQLLGYRTSLRLAWTTYQDTVSR